MREMSKHFALYHSAYFGRRCEIFIGLLAISASFCLPAIGQEHKGWQSDSLPANSSASESDTQQIYGILLKMLDRWNAHTHGTAHAQQAALLKPRCSSDEGRIQVGMHPESAKTRTNQVG
jgi:hypothetical protein